MPIVRVDKTPEGHVTLMTAPGKFTDNKKVFTDMHVVKGWGDKKVPAKYLAHHTPDLKDRVVISEELQEINTLVDAGIYASLEAGTNFSQACNPSLLEDEENDRELLLLEDSGVRDLYGCGGYNITTNPGYSG